MITEFTKQDFYKIRHIADKCDNIEVRAVVSGVNPGQVYVDHPTEPTAALIWIQGQTGFQVVGDPKSKSFLIGLEPFMRTYIEPNLKKQNISCIEIGGDETWKGSLEEIFSNRDLSNDIQHVFRLSEVIEPNEIHTDGVKIRRLDEDVLKSRGFENQSYLEDKISRFWDSNDDFLQHGFGYIAEHNNYVVSSCFSAFVADQTHAIDIETLEGYRKRNFGALVARAFVEECKLKGTHPYWDCTPENTGSIRLAKSVGMSLDFNYRIFWYNMN